MHTRHYALKKFEMYSDQKEGVLLYTPEVSAHIKNKKVIELLYELQKNFPEISVNYFSECIKRYTLEHEHLEKYLVEDLKILSMPVTDGFNKLFIVADDLEIKNNLDYQFSKQPQVKPISELKTHLLDSESLILVLTGVYKPETIQWVYQAAQQTNAWVISAYIASHYLIIDNMFNHNSGVPCHFCNFNRHKHVMMANGRMKKSAWLNFCKYTFSQSLDIIPSKTLNHAEKGLATFWLTKIVNQVVSSQSRTLFLKEMTQYKWINLINGDIGYEQSVHWPFCECLSES